MMPVAMTPFVIDQAGIEIHTADGVLLKQYVFPLAGMVLPQHGHVYDHTTMVVRGAVKVSRDDGDDKVYQAPTGIFIPAGVKHTFETLEPNTVVWCIHNAMRPDVAAVLAEHELEF